MYRKKVCALKRMVWGEREKEEQGRAGISSYTTEKRVRALAEGGPARWVETGKTYRREGFLLFLAGLPQDRLSSSSISA